MEGGSFTDCTVTWKVSVAVNPPSSRTITEIVATPKPLASGARISVRLGPEPLRSRLAVGINDGFDELAETTRLDAGVSTSPIMKVTVSPFVSSFTIWSAMSEMTGGSLTGFTASTNTRLALLLFVSVTVIVMVALPVWFVAGSSVTVRLLPLPPKVMFEVGTRLVLDEARLNVKSPGSVVSSPIVKAITCAVSSAVD